MNTRAPIIILAVVLLLIIAYFIFVEREYDGNGLATSTPVATTTTTSIVPPPQPTADATSSGRVTVTYTDSGFSPATVTVAPGTTVTFVNQSGSRMWVSSDIHPLHASYDGTSIGQHCANGSPTSSNVFDQCRADGSFSFTFTKTGTWKYHNHANPSRKGTVEVR